MSLGIAWGNYARTTALTPVTGYVLKVTPIAITIPSGSTQATQTVPAFNTAMSFLVWGNTNLSTTASNTIRRARIEATNSTTITAYRNAAATQAVTVYATLVECDSTLIDSVQQGVASITSGTTGTQTISSVDVSRSEVFFLGNTTTVTGNNANVGVAGVRLASSTSVEANVGVAAVHDVGFVVVQFKAAVIKSIQRFNTAYTTTNTVDTQSISSVDPDNCMIAFGGAMQGATVAAHGLYGISISSATNVNLTRGTADATTRTPYYSIIEFQPGILASVARRGSIVLTSLTTGTDTLSPAVGTKAVPAYVGQSIAYVSTDPAIIQESIELTSTTVVTAKRTTANASATAAYYQVTDFN